MSFNAVNSNMDAQTRALRARRDLECMPPPPRGYKPMTDSTGTPLFPPHHLAKDESDSPGISRRSRVYRPSLETRRRLGWVTTDSYHRKPPRYPSRTETFEAQVEIAPAEPVTPPVTTNMIVQRPENLLVAGSGGLVDALGMLFILVLINTLGPCCFVYAGLRVVLSAILKRSA